MTATLHRNTSLAAVPATSSRPTAAAIHESVLSGAATVATALTECGGPSDRGEWLGLAGTCQSLINTLVAVQDTALAEAARRESDWCEDGALGETVHAPGHITLDAADLSAPLIGASHAQAQRRLELAVRLASNRAPVPAEQRDLPELSGLTGLHTAMAEGRLDGYRAGVVAFELELAPADVAEAVVTALAPRPGDDSTTLRQRTRRLIERISPDLLRQRAQRARASTGLRRWACEPGVDEWHGTFPSEDAASAWAAIDGLAHDLVTAGTCSNIEQARGKALTDLVTGNATVDVQIVLTVPADSHPAPDAPEVTEAVGTAEGDHPQSPAAMHAGEPAPSFDRSPSTEADGVAQETTAAVPGEAGTGGVQAPADAGVGGVPAITPPAPAGCGDDLIEVQGSRPSEPLLVRRSWLRDHLRKRPPQPRRGRPKNAPAFVPCDPLTGARLDPRGDLATVAYRPSAELTALVKARDGRCRFPGCCVAARCCDLDHVRPWPVGPTSATNLLTLCRRHHRIKQRPGWKLRLAPDGAATWTDPTGRVRTTAPLDALHTLLLPADPADPTGATAAGLVATPAAPVARSVWSALEHHLTFRLEHLVHPMDVALRTHPTHRRCTSAAELRAGHAPTKSRAQWPDEPPF